MKIYKPSPIVNICFQISLKTQKNDLNSSDQMSKLKASIDKDKFAIRIILYNNKKSDLWNRIPAQTEGTLFHTYPLKGRILRVKK